MMSVDNAQLDVLVLAQSPLVGVIRLSAMTCTLLIPACTRAGTCHL